MWMVPNSNLVSLINNTEPSVSYNKALKLLLIQAQQACFIVNMLLFSGY